MRAAAKYTFQHKAPAWLLVLIVTYAVILPALTILNFAGADLWWFGAFNFFIAGNGLFLLWLTSRTSGFAKTYRIER